jgi:hypothetical protein
MIVEEQKNKRRGLFQVIVVTLFLVVLPLMTFWVQNSGAAEGRALYKDLKQNLGLLPATFAATSYANEPFESDKLRGQTLVVSWATSQSRDSILSVMRTIDRVSQFQEEVDNLQFVTFDTSADSTFFKNYYVGLTRNEREKWQILRGGADIQQNIKLPNDYAIALVDTSGIIRRFYDIREANERRLLIEHISIMPLRKKKTIEKKDQKKM